MKTWMRDRIGGARGAILALLTAATLFGGWMLPACSAQSTESGDDGAVAEVMGKTVTEAELEEAAADQLKQVEMQMLACQAQAEQRRHQVMETSLDSLVQERIIAAEAEARGVTSDELLETEVESKITEVTDAEVDAWYEANKGRIGNRPKEQIAPQIQQFLGQQRRDQVYTAFVEGLEDKYDVRILLEPPRTEVAADGPAKGPDGAPITIVEFSDFECPFCSRVNPTLAQVQETYGDKVRIVFRQYPLPIHANAQKAAEASLCAHDQGKFWEMHDVMFAGQRELSVDQLKAKASQIGLDTDQFNQCLDSNQHADAVQADLKAGAEAGVQGTPAMFINGISVSGAVPYEQVSEIIDDELDRKGLGE